MRTRGTSPHHAAALLRAFEIDEDPGAVDAGRAIEHRARSLEASVIEEEVTRCGGCASAVRSPATWEAHPVCRAARRDPVIAFDHRLATADAVPLRQPKYESVGRQCVRVLDVTRVLAGPVAGRTMAAMGADVLRIDPPNLPEIARHYLDTSPGKRSAILDLADVAHRERLLVGST